jgi:NAD(P)-dependent dehydrogenase (short-subunit alcohol dehydrogenase family)
MAGTTNLAGRTALVTGAGRRLGRVIALELGRAGADVVIHYRSSVAGALEAVRLLESRGVRAWAIRADLADPAGIDALAEAVSLRPGRLDILVNSAADYARAPLEAIDPGQWDDMLALNLRAPVLLVRRLLPLLARSPAAAVVNIVDLAAFKPWSHHLHYAVSKAGLLAATRCLAVELAPGIRVNAVAPGTVIPAAGQGEADLEAIRARTPLRRLATPEDVAAAVLFLAGGPRSLTGQVIPVDGGLSLA